MATQLEINKPHTKRLPFNSSINIHLRGQENSLANVWHVIYCGRPKGAMHLKEFSIKSKLADN
jgi:hypothetical protein